MIGTQSASYGCTALKGTNKAGVVKPDASGYYTLVVGALDFFNSGGAYYPLGPAKAMFDEAHSFQRRIRNGCLFGEMGHPRPGQMNMQQFMARVMDIDEKNVCCHFRRVYLDYDRITDAKGRKVVAIMAEVKPAGPMGPALQSALDNPDENVCFSIRSITNDKMMGGVLNKAIKTIVTFDKVTEPGISIATRWNAPGLESFILEDHLIVPAHLHAVARRQRETQQLGLESGSVLSAESVLQDLGWIESIRTAAPPSNRW
jgi:hypothetical protein